jgi:hypothetical protein
MSLYLPDLYVEELRHVHIPVQEARKHVYFVHILRASYPCSFERSNTCPAIRLPEENRVEFPAINLPETGLEPGPKWNPYE